MPPVPWPATSAHNQACPGACAAFRVLYGEWMVGVEGRNEAAGLRDGQEVDVGQDEARRVAISFRYDLTPW